MLYKPVTNTKKPVSSTYYNGIYIKFILLLISSIIISGLILLILWMNGTLWESSSITNYQYNTTGIVLTIILSICGIIFNLWVCLCFLVLTSKPTFTKKSLELMVHSAVNDYNKSIAKHTKDQIYQRGLLYFNKKRVKYPGVDKDQIIFATKREECFKFIHKRFMLAYPKLVLKNPDWGLNNVGGIYARQLIMMINFKEYICIWGAELAQSGFSGYYPHLNEGDVVISGLLKSAEFNSEESLIATYKFGDTSELKNGRGRHYILSEGCYMISYGLHKNTQMWRVFYNGLIMPYLFQNGDTKSFLIQLGDSTRSILKWIIYRIEGGE